MVTPRRGAGLAALVLLVSLAPAMPASAAAVPPSCVGRPDPRSEFVSCPGVSVALSSRPTVGGLATLTIDVPTTGTAVTADLVGGLEWAGVPAGFAASALSSVDPADLGGVRRATGAAPAQRFTATVRAIAPGPARVTVRLAASRARADVHLTVAGRGGVSTSGMAADTHSAVVTHEGPVIQATPRPHKPAESRSAPFSVTATACVTGGWQYKDHVGIMRPSPNYGVEVWDKDALDGVDDLLAAGLTDGSGKYTLCFSGVDNDGGLSDGGQDVFVRFVAGNAQWRVQDVNNGLPFHYDTGLVKDLASGTHDYGLAMPGDPLHMLGVEAYDATNDAWNWVIGDCWDDKDALNACSPVVVNWRWDSAKGTFYDPNVRQVFLLAADPAVRDVTVHEVTHAVMDDVYEFVQVPNSDCPNHEINAPSSAGCAWVEGFAEWVPVRVYQDPVFNLDPTTSLNLETPTWLSLLVDNGLTVEARVAGALLDLSDSTNESPWDKLAEGDANIWATFLNHKSNDIFDFWAQRTADGFNVAPSGGLACLYQNTIDFTFREPLGDNTPLSRPTPPPAHNYSYNTTTGFWSVVAVRPPAGVDYDLRLFDDKAQGTQLASSAFSGSTVDFIAVDSNAGRRPLGDYYPRVAQFLGTGSFTIELAQGSQTLLANGSASLAMASTKLVAVRDTSLTANVPVTIKVSPSSGTQDAELFIVQSVAGTPATYIRTRSAVLASATSKGPGLTESVTFTPPTSGWYGVVVVNKAGSGTYTLSRL